MVNRKTLNSHHNAQLATQFYALRFTLYAQLSTLNAQLTTRNLFSLSRPNLFVADATPTSIISVCRSPVRGEIFVLNGTRDRVKRRHGETETRRNGERRTKMPTDFLRITPLRIMHHAFSSSPVPRPSSRSVICVIFVTVKSKMAKMAGK